MHAFAVRSPAKMRRGAVVLLAGLLGCAQLPPAPPALPTRVAPFSAAQPGGAYPGGWYALGFTKFRKETRYTLVDDCGTTVVRAHSEGSSSGLVEMVEIDPRKDRWVTWRWKVSEFVAGIDNTRRETDDAPARVDISFDGDSKNLTLQDRLWAAQVKALSGIDLPYATIEYVWGEGAPAETVIPNSWTPRIRMIMVERGANRVGQWVGEKRNIYEDYRCAFGEDPGKITTIGIITDTDATGGKAEAYYGDIAFWPQEPIGEPGAELGLTAPTQSKGEQPAIDCTESVK